MDLRTTKRIFLVAKQAEGVTNRTLETYTTELTRFFEYAASKDIFNIGDISTADIRDFLNSLKEKKLRNITIHRYYRELKTLFFFLHQEEYIKANPMKHVKPPKVEQKQMRTFTAQEISKLLNCFDRDEFFGLRNYCIMATFFSTGMRKMELLNLRTVDLNITNELIRIAYGKGNKERYVPIGKTLRRIFMQYLKVREEYLAEDECPWLFVSRKKAQMTGSCVNVLFCKLKKELKLTGEKISSHTWRHTFAKNYLLNGGDVFSLQKMMGHADLETTRQYLSLNNEEMKLQHARYNPLDNRDWMI
jgi:site-specific recombinase XerD